MLLWLTRGSLHYAPWVTPVCSWLILGASQSGASGAKYICITICYNKWSDLWRERSWLNYHYVNSCILIEARYPERDTTHKNPKYTKYLIFNSCLYVLAHSYVRLYCKLLRRFCIVYSIPISKHYWNCYIPEEYVDIFNKYVYLNWSPSLPRNNLALLKFL